MNNKNYTQKSIESINNSITMAKENSIQQVTSLHLLYSLLDEQSLIYQILTNMAVVVSSLKEDCFKKIEKMPKVSGGEQYLSADFSSVVDHAEKVAKEMKDEFTYPDNCRRYRYWFAYAWGRNFAPYS